MSWRMRVLLSLVLACGSQKLLEAAFGFAVQPDGEWHDPASSMYYD